MIPPAPLGHLRQPSTTLAALAKIPQEEIWLAKQKSARTGRAYRLDVQHFMCTLGITAQSELRQVDYRAVINWSGTCGRSSVRRHRDYSPAPGSPLQPVQASGVPRPCSAQSGDGSRAPGDQPRRRHHARFLEIVGATWARPSCTIGAAKTRRGRRLFLRRTDKSAYLN